MVPSEPPSYDGHREETFGLIHPIAPHYNTLLRVDPTDKTGTKPVGDLAESWTVSKDQQTYTFKLRKGVKFHDGSEMTSKDVKASYDKIIFPPAGVKSLRKEAYVDVEAVEAPDPTTVVFKLKYPESLDPLEPGLAVELHLQGRHPRQGPALVREEHHGHRALHVRRAREGLALGRQEEPELLGQGQALPRRLPRDLHQQLLRPGGGHPRRARHDPVPRLQPARARQLVQALGPRSPCRRAPGTA